MFSSGARAQISGPQSPHVCLPWKQQQCTADLLPPGGSEGSNTPGYIPTFYFFRTFWILNESFWPHCVVQFWQDVIIPELMKKLDILGDNGVRPNRFHSMRVLFFFFLIILSRDNSAPPSTCRISEMRSRSPWFRRGRWSRFVKR